MAGWLVHASPLCQCYRRMVTVTSPLDTLLTASPSAGDATTDRILDAAYEEILTFGLRRASVEEHMGWMICELGGEDEAVDRAVEWLRDLGVQVDRLGDVVES